MFLKPQNNGQSNALLVSMPSVHFKRWVKSLPSHNYSFYWFDILSRGSIGSQSFESEIINWREQRLRGGDRVKTLFPNVFKILERFFRVTQAEAFAEIVKNLRPSIVHTFEFQNCTFPILEEIEKRDFRWIYSCWGSDIYWFGKIEEEREKLKRAMKRLDVLHTDCERDIRLAKELGFKGRIAAVIPGGGGYHLDLSNSIQVNGNSRKLILVKGYQHQFGRAIPVLKALNKCREDIADFTVAVFSPHPIVEKFIADEMSNLGIQIFKGLNHQEFLELMSKSKIYIGNSISDGIPNTLIESMLMGAFPIQSNPGGVTEELIVDGENGLLISDPENTDEIAKVIRRALSDNSMIMRAREANDQIVRGKFSFESVKAQIQSLYNLS